MYRSEHHQWVEAFHHHLRTSVSEAVHGSQYHTEAVEERHAHAKLVVACELHVLAGEETVVRYIIMSEHYAFRESGRARGVLHVHYIVASHFFLGFDEFFVLDVASEEENLSRIVHTPVLFLSDVDDILHPRETFALQVAALAGLQLGEHGVDHIDEVIAAAVAVHDTEGVHVRILAEVFQFRLLVVGVYRHRHGPNLGTGIKEGQPVGHVSCPDAYMGSFFHSDGKQSFGHVVHTFVELAPSEAQVAVRVNDVFFIGSGRSPMLQPVAEGSV